MEDGEAIELTKLPVLGAVTALVFSQDATLLLAGIGSYLHVFRVQDGQRLYCRQLLRHNPVHQVELEYDVDRAIVFGGKSLIVLSQVPEGALSCEQRRRVDGSYDILDVRYCLQDLDDLILAAQLLPKRLNTDAERLAIGFAHNYVEIWCLETLRMVHKVVSSVRCLLYSMQFAPQCTATAAPGTAWPDLMIASGTVFSKVVLWSLEGNGETLHALSGHLGVIFRIQWSSDGSMLATCSDDRTIRLWKRKDVGQTHLSALEEAWTGWGHKARVWDVQFAAIGLISASEDATLRIWDWSGTCLAELVGHAGKNVRRVTISASPLLPVVASGGDDSAIKLWDLRRHLISNAMTERAAATIVPPEVQDTTLEEAGAAEHVEKFSRDSARAMAITNGGTILYVGFSSTGLWAYDMTDAKWRAVGLTFTQRESVTHVTIPPKDRHVLAGTSRGSIFIFAIPMAEADRKDQINNEHILMASVAGAHQGTITLLHYMHQQCDGRMIEETLYSSGADGCLRQWGLPFNNKDERVDATTKELVPLACYRTACGKSVAFTALGISCEFNIVVAGDSRGRLMIFKLAEQERSMLRAEGVEILPYRKFYAHGRDQVSAIKIVRNYIYSIGHDGYIQSYVIEGDGHVSLEANSDIDSSDRMYALRPIGRVATHPISIPRQIWISSSGQLILGGYTGSDCIVWNVTSSQQLLKAHAGNWRRPHALWISETDPLQSLTLVHAPPPPTRKSPAYLKTLTTVQSLACYRKTPDATLTDVGDLPEIAESTAANEASCSRWFASASLHVPLHGRIIPAALWLKPGLVATGSEDNAVKILYYQLEELSEAASAPPPTCLGMASGHLAGIRAMALLRSRPELDKPAKTMPSLFFTAGGRNMIKVWRLPGGPNISGARVEDVGTYEKDHPVQDQRLTSISCHVLPDQRSEDAHRCCVVVAGDSEGSLIFLIYCDLSRSLLEIGQTCHSLRPILALKVVSTAGRFFVLSGSTDGKVHVTDFSSCVAQLPQSHLSSEDSLSAVRSQFSMMPPIIVLDCHQMGVNCLDAAWIPCDAQNKKSLLMVTGGDDQALGLAKFALSEDAPLTLLWQRYLPSASSSALKGISLHQMYIFAVGYDQRLTVWKYTTIDEEAEAAVEPLYRVTETIVDVADVHSLDVVENERYDLWINVRCEEREMEPRAGESDRQREGQRLHSRQFYRV